MNKFIRFLNKIGERHDEPGINEFPQKDLKLSKNLDVNTKILKDIFGENNDIVFRRFSFGQTKREALLLSVDGLVDSKEQANNIIKPMMYDSTEDGTSVSGISDIEKKYLVATETKIVNTIGDICTSILNSDTALIVDGLSDALIINTKGYPKRAIDDPQTESILRGPREAFNESIRTNTALIRRRIKDPSLMIENITLGQKSQTAISIVYMRDIVNKQLVDEIKNRLGTILTDNITDSGFIEQYISDKHSWLFPTINNTERPDVAAARILEGRVGIIVDGSPYVLTAPMLFLECFQTTEDYNIAPLFATTLRIIRFIAFIISLLILPAYVALTTFHQELLPTTLLFTTAVAEGSTPFPSVIEGIIMVITFEILKEAGIRLPRPAGQAVSMVGAIIIGDTAVSAGIIGAPMVISVALTSVSAFAVPSQANASTIIRMGMLLLAGFMGGYGIILGLLAIFTHLTSMRSFGTPYLSPWAPLRTPDLKDSLVRFPLRDFLTRPLYMSRRNPRRQKD